MSIASKSISTSEDGTVSNLPEQKILDLQVSERAIAFTATAADQLEACREELDEVSNLVELLSQCLERSAIPVQLKGVPVLVHEVQTRCQALHHRLDLPLLALQTAFVDYADKIAGSDGCGEYMGKKMNALGKKAS